MGKTMMLDKVCHTTVTWAESARELQSMNIRLLLDLLLQAFQQTGRYPRHKAAPRYWITLPTQAGKFTA